MTYEEWFKSLNENGRTTYFLGQEGKVSKEAWDYQQKKIDKLQAKVDEVLKVCDNLRTDLIRENHVEYDKGWKDCATSIYHQLKGNKDDGL